MSRRVSKAAVAVLVVLLTLNASAAWAAPRERDQPIGVQERIVRVLRQAAKWIKPILKTQSDDDSNHMPSPPKP